MLRSTVEALMADERAKSHHILADRLQRALQAVSVTPPVLTNAQPIQGNGRDIILELTPRVRFEDLVLTLPARAEGKQLIEEHMRADVLRAHGYEPRHKVLLSGPPGNGKTSYAEAVAEALALPFFVVRYDALIGSYLGETNTRLRKLFDYVRTQPCVLFFDEFDSIGKERGDTHETGEIKRVVSFLLMQIDQLPSYVLTIAATNHAELLDRAVWRRFQLRMAFPAPQENEIAAFLHKIIESWSEKPKVSALILADWLGAMSYAEARDFCQNVRRRHILGLGEVSIDSAIRVELDLWASRVKPEVTNVDRPKQTPPLAKRQRTTTKTTRAPKSPTKT
ncbi:ATP-binding protein [Nitrosospira lacus]|uniref:AAA family ATPase n=2 Tax=Nitrosospira lacus TaxID=1288494 RepID=A0A1W6STQ4_9PROT|nr:ATP-binding protein [Nitrosospira lacus]